MGAGFVVRRMHSCADVPPARRVDLADDEAFDELLPIRLQLKSSLHFTPVDVARLAARMLAPEPGMSVLDVGAGAGKFCLAAALAMPAVQFVGVEWRPHLVRVATRIARAWGLTNVRFTAADALELDWSGYDAFYFYNPFAEQLFDTELALDRSIDLDAIHFLPYVTAVSRKLADARLGTRVVTYHGYGAPLPLGYALAQAVSIGTDRVELWLKTQATASGAGSLL